MKRYLIHVVIIALGTLIFTPPVLASHSSGRTQNITVASEIQTPTTPVEATTTAQNTPSTSQPATPAQNAPAAPKTAPAVSTPPPPPTTPEGIMAAAGIAPSDYQYVNYIISHESGWCWSKWEGQIGVCPGSYTAVYSPYYPYKGYGLCQSTPAIKMASVGADWATNPVTQLKWCSIHAAQKGGWYAAYLYWTSHGNW